jgi:ATP-dependent helicase/nuclease subunit B
LDYLELGKDGVKPTTCAQGKDLQPLLQRVEQRLTVMDRALQQAAPLPAWGDDKVCGYCEFSGLCRRDTWPQEEDNHD